MTVNGLMNPTLAPVSFLHGGRLAEQTDRSLSIEARHIHVWGADLDDTSSFHESYHRWLDVEEQERAARLVQEQDRHRFVLAHALLRAVLSRYVACRPAAIRFGRQPGGKPILMREDAPEPIEFSLAHSQARMVIAVAKGEAIGIDLEQIRETADVLKLAERFYRPSECAQIANLPARQQQRQFYRYWVAKEAVLKGEGIGLSSLQDCEVLTSGYEERACVRLRPDAAECPQWNVQWLSCGPGWEGAVAFQGDCNVRVMSAG